MIIKQYRKLSGYSKKIINIKSRQNEIMHRVEQMFMDFCAVTGSQSPVRASHSELRDDNHVVGKMAVNLGIAFLFKLLGIGGHVAHRSVLSVEDIINGRFGLV